MNIWEHGYIVGLIVAFAICEAIWLCGIFMEQKEERMIHLIILDKREAQVIITRCQSLLRARDKFVEEYNTDQYELRGVLAGRILSRDIIDMSEDDIEEASIELQKACRRFLCGT